MIIMEGLVTHRTKHPQQTCASLKIMNVFKTLVGKQSSSGECLLCTVCGKQVKGSFKISHDKSGIYMGPNGVVIHDFAAGRRGLCHNKCVKKGRV